jgi:3-deoxy-D-manno-octulosonic acid (KDO) 8-phosphate synthase
VSNPNGRGHGVNPRLLESKAHSIAMRALKDLHRDEWVRLLAEAREMLGVPAFQARKRDQEVEALLQRMERTASEN